MDSNRELEECTSTNNISYGSENYSIQPQDPRSQEELDQEVCYKRKDICVIITSVTVIFAIMISLIIVTVLRLKY